MSSRIGDLGLGGESGGGKGFGWQNRDRNDTQRHDPATTARRYRSQCGGGLDLFRRLKSCQAASLKGRRAKEKKVLERNWRLEYQNGKGKNSLLRWTPPGMPQ